jgi:hypothetical protein
MLKRSLEAYAASINCTFAEIAELGLSDLDHLNVWLEPFGSNLSSAINGDLFASSDATTVTVVNTDPVRTFIGNESRQSVKTTGTPCSI